MAKAVADGQPVNIPALSRQSDGGTELSSPGRLLNFCRRFERVSLANPGDAYRKSRREVPVRRSEPGRASSQENPLRINWRESRTVNRHRWAGREAQDERVIPR